MRAFQAFNLPACRRRFWTSRIDGGMNAPPLPISRMAAADENVSPALLHLVERGNPGHVAVDLAARRARGRGRVRQSRYYRAKGGKIDPALGFERRWVIYNGVAEASTVPPSWHGWLHHTVDVPPTLEKVTPRPWWKPHRPNLTGTPGAHRPTGSTLAQGRRPKATGDYKPWTPGR
jgi:NADH:ubiquinone oxidoreductase subunit